MRVLIVSKKIDSKNDASMTFNKCIIDFCYNIFSPESIQLLDVPFPNKRVFLKNVLLREPFGYNSKIGREIKKIELDEKDLVILLSSTLIKYVKKFFKNATTLVFFQNVESIYCKHKYLSSKRISDYFLYKYMFNTEKTVKKYCTYIHSLNDRDASNISSLYKRKVDLVLPLCFDEFKPSNLVGLQNDSPNYVLFIGSNFYANVDGLKWFIKKVLPYINCDLYVVGSCCDSPSIRNELPLRSNLKLLGFVDDFSEVVVNAIAVVCPIFSGSGMKTKTVEAMRYGKTILGTNEAFAGISCDFTMVGSLCNSPEAFVSSINREVASPKKFNQYSFDFFVENYSYSKCKNKFLSFIEKNVKWD